MNRAGFSAVLSVILACGIVFAAGTAVAQQSSTDTAKGASTDTVKGAGSAKNGDKDPNKTKDAVDSNQGRGNPDGTVSGPSDSYTVIKDDSTLQSPNPKKK